MFRLHTILDSRSFAVCKTCSDYKHVCLGYSDSTAHLRSQSDSASRTPTVPPLAGRNDPSHRVARAVESCSPEPPSAKIQTEKPQQVPRPLGNKEGPSRDTFVRTNKDTDSQAAGDSPESSKSGMLREITCSLRYTRIRYRDIDHGRLLRSDFRELQQPYPCSIFQVLRTDSHCSWLQADGWVPAKIVV